MANISHTQPIQLGEEASLRANTQLHRWMHARLRRAKTPVLTDDQFHSEISKPLTLQFARAIVNKPNGKADPKSHAPR